ncbi:MAG: ribosome biogenesis GTPase Der [Sedimentisphaerales bacterium]|nr:ribosome biogenesis GTPase Der [Sedimentisphaerales bacterium]
MALPIVAIIGRPNVGKSSLLNALAGARISIVEPTAGVTRDRISTIIEKNNRYFELIDTGGYGIVDANQLSEHIEKQIMQAIESANLVLFMVDIREGLVPLDKKIAQLLHKHGLDVIGVANKADTARMFSAAAEFSKLGFGEFLCISAKNNLNKAVLLDMIFEKIAHLETFKPSEPVMKLAIVGKRNAGKSTLLNAIVGSERVIVSEIPGTTRDAVNVRFEKDGRTIIIIDTAGARKKSKIGDSSEFYSSVRTAESIRRADVVLLLIDAAEPVSQVDKKLADFITQEYKSCIIVINKWDLAKDVASTSDYEQYLTEVLPALSYAPMAFTTANRAKNVQSVLDLAAGIFKQSTTRIRAPKLNKAFEAIKAESPGSAKSKSAKGGPKTYYAVQIAVNPITLLMFVNKHELFDENYRRFIIGKLRKLLPISEVPIKLVARSHKKERK